MTFDFDTAVLTITSTSKYLELGCQKARVIRRLIGDDEPIKLTRSQLFRSAGHERSKKKRKDLECEIFLRGSVLQAPSYRMLRR